MEIFLRSELELDALAREVEAVLQPEKVERRYGLNLGGGAYYRFQREGHEYQLVSNEGEVEIPEMAAFRFFFRLWTLDGDPATKMAATLAHALAARGIATEIVDIGA